VSATSWRTTGSKPQPPSALNATNPNIPKNIKSPSRLSFSRVFP
jgi:hypothetical protein